MGLNVALVATPISIAFKTKCVKKKKEASCVCYGLNEAQYVAMSPSRHINHQ